MPEGFETPEEVLRRGELEKPQSTADELDHYIANKLTPVICWHQAGRTDKDFDKPRGEFIDGIEATIALDLPESGGITNLHLIEFVDMANAGSWENPADVKPIYRLYCDLRKQPYLWD